MVADKYHEDVEDLIWMRENADQKQNTIINKPSYVQKQLVNMV